LIFDSWWIARTREEEEEEEGRQVDQVQQEDGIDTHEREYIDGKNICMCRSIGLDPIVEPWTGRAASVAPAAEHQDQFGSRGRGAAAGRRR